MTTQLGHYYIQRDNGEKFPPSYDVVVCITGIPNDERVRIGWNETGDTADNDFKEAYNSRLRKQMHSGVWLGVIGVFGVAFILSVLLNMTWTLEW